MSLKTVVEPFRFSRAVMKIVTKSEKVSHYVTLEEDITEAAIVS